MTTLQPESRQADPSSAAAHPELDGLGRYDFGWSDTDTAGLNARRGLSREVVENISALKNEPEWMLKLRLKGLGLSLAVDNFGVGYSSLSYLKQFPVDSLKIDRTFIAAMTDARESTALIHTLVQLGKDLGIETLAEGIEEHGQFNRLRAEECDSGQGFLFARPLAASAVGAFLEIWAQSEADEPGVHQPSAPSRTAPRPQDATSQS